MRGPCATLFERNSSNKESVSAWTANLVLLVSQAGDTSVFLFGILLYCFYYFLYFYTFFLESKD